MFNNIGSDLMFVTDEDNEVDLMLTVNGDLMSTSDFESIVKNKIPYEGYISLYNSIYTMLQASKGTYFYNMDFGNNINEYISSTIDEDLFLIKDDLERELRKDDRVKQIKRVDLTINGDTLEIEIEFIAIGQQEVSMFVFPYSIKEL